MRPQRWLLPVVLGALALAACTSSATSVTAPDAGYCESNGYEPPTGGSCPKGTCHPTGAASECCGSLCASCEAKGLVPFTDAGTCPTGLCESTDVTAELSCCDVCLGSEEAGSEAGEASVESGADAAEEPPPDASDGGGHK